MFTCTGQNITLAHTHTIKQFLVIDVINPDDNFLHSSTDEYTAGKPCNIYIAPGKPSCTHSELVHYMT